MPLTAILIVAMSLLVWRTAAVSDVETCFNNYVSNQQTVEFTDSDQYFTTVNGIELECSTQLVASSVTGLPVQGQIANGTLINGTIFFNGTLSGGIMIDSNLTYGKTVGGENCAIIRADITGISYGFCAKFCGSGLDPFNWNNFSGRFTSWLLPWLALISQLPCVLYKLR